MPVTTDGKWLAQVEGTVSCSREQKRWKQMLPQQLRNYEQNVCREGQMESKAYHGRLTMAMLLVSIYAVDPYKVEIAALLSHFS